MEYKYPLFKLNFNHEEEEAVVETLRSKWISTGPKTIEFEKKFSQMFESKYSLALTNCTVSLHTALIALEIGIGDEVICPSLTFVATANVIRYVNATPVFCDIRGPKDLTIDPNAIEACITNRTKAIIVMHYAGFSCEMRPILDIASKYNLRIIEDASHAPLSEYNGQKLGTIGDIGCFSFFSNKNISTGEGGMIVTESEELYLKAKSLRSHGMTSLSYDRAKGHSSAYNVIDLGYNYRMDDIRASIGIVQLKKLREDLKKRAIIRELYEKKLGDINEVVLPFIDHNHFSSNYIFPVLLNSKAGFKYRDKARNYLHSKGIQTSIHYPPIHRFSIYKEFYKKLPITDEANENLLTLPMYGDLSSTDIAYISDSLLNFIRK